MPELPDVETFRRYLDATALHERIEHIHAERLEDLGGLSHQRLAGTLTGRTIDRTDRHGKFLFAELDGGGALVLHFGMTGFLAYYRDEASAPGHVRLRLDFADGYHLAYDCQRLLGRIDVTDDVAGFIEDDDLGPDALAIDRSTFASLLGGKRGSLKAALMDQSSIAGLGNVYADEILLQARIHPESDPRALDDETVHRLYRVMRRVLGTATDRKADPTAFPGSWLTPRREDGAPCPRCDGELAQLEISGRTTYVCASCQRKYAPR